MPEKSSRTATKIPPLRLHKPTGQGYVRLDGRMVYLGRYDLPETQEKYNHVVAEYLVGAGKPPPPAGQITVLELIERYLDFARNYYMTAEGETNAECSHLVIVCRPLKELYGRTLAAQFGPLALRAVRERLIQKDWCRKHVNHNIGRIKRIFRWATENELVPGGVYHALQAVAGLRRGRSKARESHPVKPVPQDRVDAVKPFVSRQVWAMIEMQRLTGARGGEIAIMRPCDIDRSSKVWVYKPTKHKTAYCEHERYIYIGPEAQKRLSPFLLRSPEAYCFSPKEAMEERHQESEASRVTPPSYGNSRGTNRKRKPMKAPGERYTSMSYYKAIQYALCRAFQPPEHLARKKGELVKEWEDRLEKDGLRDAFQEWCKQHHWHPHQLRHNAATELRKEFGLEAARIILGHRSAAITEIYAEEDKAKAIAAISQVG